MLHHLGDPTDSRRDHRKPDCRCLEQDDRHPLPGGREDVPVGSAHEVRHVSSNAKELDPILYALLFDERLYLTAQRALPDQNQP